MSPKNPEVEEAASPPDEKKVPGKRRPGAGGARPGAGRPKGSKNKATAEVREIAKKHGPEAVKILADIMQSRTYPVAGRVAAAREILDRAYGKAPQALTGPGGGALEVENFNIDLSGIPTDSLRQVLHAIRANMDDDEGAAPE